MPAHEQNRNQQTHLVPARASAQLEAIRPAYFFTPDLEREINKLDGITAARVVTLATEIAEIHVLALPHRPPKKIVRDIESLLMVRFGIRVDHRCISVVQSDQIQSVYPRGSRPQIHRVLRDEDRVRVSVHVDGTEITGVSRVHSADTELENVGWALIHAIEQLLNTSGVLALESVQVCETRAQRVIVVLVRWRFAGQEEVLVGASLVQSDILEAAARATLGAMNRRLVRFQDAAKQSDTLKILSAHS